MNSPALLLSLLLLAFAVNFKGAKGQNSSLFTSCPSGWTSCGAGCCPLPSAVCCSDGVHCCPSGYSCNYTVGGCVKNGLHSPFFNKKSTEDAIQKHKSSLIMPCPSGWSSCGGGCCPLPSAVCCSNGAYCCPNGYSCNSSVNGCVKNGQYASFFEKISKEEALQKQESSVITACPSGWTSCGAGCCPLPSAVCCSDGVHCCPNGYSCNYTVGGCVRNGQYAPFLAKKSKDAIQKQESSLIMPCPSGWSSCGGGCCPLPSAVCCSNGAYCCPNGYSCNASVNGCVKNGQYASFFEKISKEEALQRQESSVITACPSGWTSCGAGCCPLPSAVCCSDGVHCCPNGYSCNYIVGGCVRNGQYAPFFDKKSKEEAIHKLQ